METFSTEANKINVKILKMYDDVTIPFYATSGSAGCDVRAYLTDKNGYPNNKLVIRPCETIAVPTGLRFGLPEGYEMQIRPRSGLSLKTKLRVANSPGTLDQDFIFELKIILNNISINSEAVIDHGDRIAQLVFAPVTIANFSLTNDLSETDRKGGFGSTGIK